MCNDSIDCPFGANSNSKDGRMSQSLQSNGQKTAASPFASLVSTPCDLIQTTVANANNLL
jgi:hypothetical protein